MVFGLFSRKTATEPKPVAAQPQQLRTPSPSVVSGSSPRADDRHPPITPSPPPDHATDPTALRALIQSIPPKILHAYTLSHLPTASPELLPHILQFFSALEPPPLLHCVRCHKGYFDVENTDRSCVVAHDDESAEVERVGRGSGHETLWGCCGKTVDGDGDQGPPDGWCYEGMHTVDVKRARFRADSTVHDDKLISCHRKRCHEPPNLRKRARRAAAVASSDTESDSDDGASHSSVRTRSRASKRARLAREHSDTDVDEDVDMPLSASVHASPRSTTSAPKSKPRARSVVSNGSSRSQPVKAKQSKSRLSITSLEPPSPTRSPGKKPPSTRFAPSALSATTSITSMTSSALSIDGSAGTQTQTQTQTQTIVVATTKASSVKAPKTPAKRTMKPKSQAKQPKRLNEVVESSI